MMAQWGPIIQININHSVGAQDILFQTMTEWKAELAIISEPHRIPDSLDWTADLKNTVAIVRNGASSPIINTN